MAWRECFFPEKRIFAADPMGVFAEIMPKLEFPATAALAADWSREMMGFKVTARQSGYLSASSSTSPFSTVRYWQG